MATAREVKQTYDYQDEFVRLSLGPNPSITCAMYDGEFSRSLEEAQELKNEYILNGVGFRAGFRVLDIGCGWGSVLDAVRQRGGHGVGITLSPRQARACRQNGLEAHLLDWRSMTPQSFGKFDAIVSLGAFEHFCSPEEYEAGGQEGVYHQFFDLCHSLLPWGGRMYLQTMLWGKRVPNVAEIRLDAPRGSDQYVMAVLGHYYPGSWLPRNIDQIKSCSDPFFQFLSTRNGRKDYIETLEQFRRRFWKLSLRKVICALKLVPRFTIDRDFRQAIRSFRSGFNRECFVREIMDHERMLFKRRDRH